MKKIFILLFIVFLFPMTAISKDNYAQDKNAIFLNFDEEENIQDIKKGRVDMTSTDVEYTKPSARDKERETLLYKDVNRLQPEKKSVSKSIEKEVLKDTSVGATYSSTEKSGKMNDSVSVYSKYEKEHFGITTSYSQDRDSYKKNGIDGGTVSVAPELKINKHIRIKNVYSDTMSTNQKKSEVVLSVRPFKDDRLDLDLGAGETFSNGNQPAKSQINIGTKFRF